MRRRGSLLATTVTSLAGLATGFLVSSLFAACGGGAPAASGPKGEPSSASSASAEPAASASSSAPTADKPVEPSKPAGPVAQLSAKGLELTYGGKTYALGNAYVQTVKMGTKQTVELHFEQPMAEGYNQLWIIPREAKKGQAAKVEGAAMASVFLQLAEGKDKVRNVSNDCSAKGTVTYDELPTKKGDKAKGSVDVVVTCTGVPGFEQPLVVKGAFEGLPLK